jgi:hypothetical protein
MNEHKLVDQVKKKVIDRYHWPLGKMRAGIVGAAFFTD